MCAGVLATFHTTSNHSSCFIPCLFRPVLISCNSSSSYDDVKVELKGVQPNPAYGEVTPSQAQTKPQPYEEVVAIGGVTSDSVAMEEDPAYQSVDTTAPHTEEPVYL